MPKYRAISVDLNRSYDVVDMPDVMTRYIWVSLLIRLDREGRIIGDIRFLKSDLFPMMGDISYEDIQRALDYFEQRKMIVRYEIEGRKYLQAVNFKRYQPNLEREAESRIPAPPPKPQNVPVVPTQEAQAIDTDREPDAEPKPEPITVDLEPIPVQETKTETEPVMVAEINPSSTQAPAPALIIAPVDTVERDQEEIPKSREPVKLSAILPKIDKPDTSSVFTVSPPEKQTETDGIISRNPGAYRAIVEFEKRRLKPNFNPLSDYPEELRPIISRFTELWAIDAPKKGQNGFTKWLKDAWAIRDVLDGHGLDVLQEVYKTWRERTSPDGKPPYTVSSLGSIINPVRAVIGQRKAGQIKQNKRLAEFYDELKALDKALIENGVEITEELVKADYPLTYRYAVYVITKETGQPFIYRGESFEQLLSHSPNVDNPRLADLDVMYRKMMTKREAK